jgi:hypothetical protein
VAESLRVTGLLEAAIHGSKIGPLERFYASAFGLTGIAGTRGRNVVLRCGHSALVLLDPSASGSPGGPFPPHGRAGSGHAALVVDASALPA